MVKKIEILGMTLDAYTVQDAMLLLEEYWDFALMSTVENISMETLVKAHSDELIKNCIENLDLAIICDKEILKAAGVATKQRIQEAADKQFFREFMRRTVRDGRTVYLLGETREQLSLLEKILNEGYEGLQALGSYALSECEGDYDTAINEVNIAAPDIILSVIPTPAQEYFLKDHKEKLNAKVWYGLGEHYFDKKGVSEVAGFARKLFHKGMLHGILLHYHKK